MIELNDIKEKKEDFNEKNISKNEHSHCMCLYKQEARNQNLFLPAVKKTHHFWLFGNIVRDIIQNFFFSRILILHEKKEEKNYVKSDMTKKKKIQHSVM